MKLKIVDGRGPEYAHENNDCTVRAMSIAAGMPYGAAHTMFKRIGRADRAGFNTMEFLRLHNYRVCNYAVVEVTVHSQMYATTFTLAEFIRLHPQGRYILRINGGCSGMKHAIAIVDGVAHDKDKWTQGRRRVWRAWQFNAV